MVFDYETKLWFVYLRQVLICRQRQKIDEGVVGADAVEELAGEAELARGVGLGAQRLLQLAQLVLQ
jgi:hypothetical protein